MGSKGVGKKKAPETTHRETEYFRELIERQQPVRVRLMDNQEHTGTLEYFDETFVRLTRTAQPNLFVFKHDIKYLFEV
ncbi:MAG: Sm ribonucleo-like protein [Acidobacteria bacterium]|nr:Sm ribonucleo-like protein [Acidobacteriota bacterium]